MEQRGNGYLTIAPFGRLTLKFYLFRLSRLTRVPHPAAHYWIMVVIPCALASATRAWW
jgi:hypothetical protein